MTKKHEITLTLINQLRERTGMGMLDCKNALIDADGDLELAVEQLRKRGAAVAAKRSSKETSEGLVHAYVHPGARIGVLVELNCETDFVARTDDMKKFAADLCLHIAATKPLYLDASAVDQKFLEHERDIFKAQMANAGKPEKIINQIVEGKVNKLYSEVCLLNQTWIKNDQFTVTDVLNELVARLGENIKIKRFARFELGA